MHLNSSQITAIISYHVQEAMQCRQAFILFLGSKLIECLMVTSTKSKSNPHMPLIMVVQFIHLLNMLQKYY